MDHKGKFEEEIQVSESLRDPGDEKQESGEEDWTELEAMKARRAMRLKWVAVFLVLVIAAGALVGVLSGGAFSRWFQKPGRLLERGSSSSRGPEWDLTVMYTSLEAARVVLNEAVKEVEVALAEGAAPEAQVMERLLRTAEGLRVYGTLLRDGDLSDPEAKAFLTSAEALGKKVMRLKDRPGEGPSIFELSGSYERIFESFRHQYGIEFGNDPNLYSENPVKRQKAFEAWVSSLKPSAEVMADLYEGKVGFNNYLAAMYGEAGALEAFMLLDGVPPKAYRQLQSATEAQLGLNHRWMAVKARLMGIKSGLKLSDLYAPLPLTRQSFTFSQAKTEVLAALAPLPEEGQVILRRAFDEGWMDYVPRQNKFVGAYTYGAYGFHPFLLLNFDGTPDSVAELAHELGHAVHLSMSSQYQPYETYFSDVSAAELAATLTEVLYHEYRLAGAGSREEKVAALAGYLDFLSTSYFDQMLATEFEVAAHHMAQKGEDLSATSLSELWRNLMSKYLGPAYSVTSLDGYEWMNYPHLYWDFYMYKYAFGVVAGSPMAKALLEGDAQAREAWMDIMKAGGSVSGSVLMAEAGYDLTSEDLYKSFFERWSELLEELEFLLNAS